MKQMTRTKAYTGYRSFQYLQPDVDFQAFPLAKEVDRVPPYDYPLSADEQRRADEVFERFPIVSLHDHATVFPADNSQILAYVRQGREATGYEGLAASGIDAVFENFMDGTALITSKAGWKWDDIIFDLGMRYSDLAHQDLVYRAETVDDILRAKASRRIAVVPCLEAATPIENELDRVDILYGFGIRVMGITYSESNALGSGLRERRDGGLTELGRQVVRRMNTLGMAIDLAHVGDQTSLDTIEASAHPVFITHAGARRLWNTKRMKPDDVIKACAEKGGVIGIEAAPHTTITRTHLHHSLESVMEHVAYCIELVSVEHVALGPDTLFGDHVGLHQAFASQLSSARRPTASRTPPSRTLPGWRAPPRRCATRSSGS